MNPFKYVAVAPGHHAKEDGQHRHGTHDRPIQIAVPSYLAVVVVGEIVGRGTRVVPFARVHGRPVQCRTAQNDGQGPYDKYDESYNSFTHQVAVPQREEYGNVQVRRQAGQTHDGCQMCDLANRIVRQEEAVGLELYYG